VAGWRDREPGNDLDDRVELEGPERTRIHWKERKEKV
jgi:hypothetical protein